MAQLTREDEREIVKDLNRNYFKPRAGDTWYLISAKWFRAWKDFVGFDDHARSVADAPRPGPMRNGEIVDSESGDLLPKLRENVDFVIISPQVREKFCEWYGGDEPVPRRVIKTRRYFSSTAVIEVYPLVLNIATSDPDSEVKELRISKGATVAEFKEAACKLFEVDPKDVRVWDYLGKKKAAYLARDGQELREASIMNNQDMLLELRNADGKFPELPKSRVNAAVSDFRPAAEDRPAGCTGFTNLGNTCFMSSGLQCLLHTPPLVNHLLSGAYREDCNPGNPLGSNLELMEAFAELCRAMWSGRYEVVAPRDFKHTLGKHAEQFVGYDQHDSQEFLGYLLDNIHEDLNRVRAKPLVDRVESDGQKSDAEVAGDAWEAYLARNRSVIVDKFQGQFKSHLQCPVKECQRVSVTFDPFMYLSVPLPVDTTTDVRVIVQRRDQKKPEALTVTVDKKGTMADLRAKVAAAAGMPADALGPMCDVYNGTVYTIFDDSAPVTRIMRGDITWAFEMEPGWGQEEAADAADAAAGAAGAAGAGSGEQDASKQRRRAERRRRLRELREGLRSYVKTSTSVDEALKDAEARDRLAERLRGLRGSMEEVRSGHGAAHDGEAAAEAARRGEAVPCCSTATLTCGHRHGPETLERLDRTIEDLTSLEVDDEDEDEPYVSGRRAAYAWTGFSASTKPVTYAKNGWEVLVLLHQRAVAGSADHVAMAGVPCVVSYKRGRTTARDVLRQVHARIGVRCVDFDPEDADLPCDLFAVPRHDAVQKGRDLLAAGEGEGEGAGVAARAWDTPIDVQATEAVALRWHYDEAGKWLFDAKASASIHDRDCRERREERRKLSMQECMDHFCSEEILSPMDTWFCPQCKDHVQARKKVDLWALPEVLIVHLKRFQAVSAFDVFSGGDKIDALVDFPVEGFDLAPYLAASQDRTRCRADGEPAGEESTLYDLYAVSNHMGGTGGGHYTAYVLNEDGQWYVYDDTRVRKVKDVASIVSPSAYVLFYKRRDAAFDSMREAYRALPDNESKLDAYVEAQAAAHNYSYSNFGGYGTGATTYSSAPYAPLGAPYVPLGATINPAFDDNPAISDDDEGDDGSITATADGKDEDGDAEAGFRPAAGGNGLGNNNSADEEDGTESVPDAAQHDSDDEPRP